MAGASPRWRRAEGASVADKRAQAKEAAQPRVVDAKPKPRKKPKKPNPHHKRTPATERVVRALVQANPNVRHDLIAEALGVERLVVLRRYGDLIPHPGPGRPEHEPTELSRQAVSQHVALGLNHDEIAGLIGISVSCLQNRYEHELATGRARTVAQVGSRVVARALSPTDPHAQRAAEFYLDRLGGDAWTPRSRLGLDPPAPSAQDPQPLVNGTALTRQDARRVAFLLAKEAAQAPAKPEPVVLEGEVIEPPSGPVRGG